MAKISIGVSPAYHLSRYGESFRPDDVASSLKDIRSMGFSAFQLEVYNPDTLQDWVSYGSVLVSKAAEKNNIYPSQFMGHFLLHGFDSPASLFSDFGINESRLCLNILKPFPECKIITMVVPAFSLSGQAVDHESSRQFWNRLVEKIKTILEIFESDNRKLALEILPGTLIGGFQGFLRLVEIIKSANFGYNFDTGHSWSSREQIELIPGMLYGRIFGTHLKDNDQTINLSLPPGKGTIPWKSLFKNLIAAGYQGSFDLEIRCKPEEVMSQYSEGLNFLRSELLNLTGV